MFGARASSYAAAGGPSYLLNDVFDCNVAHSSTAHFTAGHMLAGATWQQSHEWYVEPTVDLLCARHNSFNSRVLSDVGSPEVTVTANIVGQVTGANSRKYGLALGGTSLANGTDAIAVTVQADGRVDAAQIASWATPNNNRGTATISDDYTLSLSLSGTTVTVGINGVTFATFSAANAVPGNLAGVWADRGWWSTTIGYRWITVEAS